MAALVCISVTGIAAAQTEKETVAIFSAGSLRGVVGELAKEAAATYNIEVQPSFGGSGSLRERIEKGESPDLLMSADVGSPQKLAAQGRTIVPAIPFARNRRRHGSQPDRSHVSQGSSIEDFGTHRRPGRGLRLGGSRSHRLVAAR
jgi:ABC-type molybdate transport system substrate-binding protein